MAIDDGRTAAVLGRKPTDVEPLAVWPRLTDRNQRGLAEPGSPDLPPTRALEA